MNKLITAVCLTFLSVTSANASRLWWFEAGLGTSYIQTYNDDTTADIRPTVFLAANKKFADNWSIGVAGELLLNKVFELDKSDNLLVWRLPNFNYEITEQLSINFYGGAARYYREHPSFGIGAGVGSSYKLTDRWSIDFGASYFSVDMSTSIPGDLALGKKDELVWASLLLKSRF